MYTILLLFTRIIEILLMFNFHYSHGGRKEVACDGGNCIRLFYKQGNHEIFCMAKSHGCLEPCRL